MPVGKKADDEPLDEGVLADDDLPDLGEEGAEEEGLLADLSGEGRRVRADAHRAGGFGRHSARSRPPLTERRLFGIARGASKREVQSGCRVRRVALSNRIRRDGGACRRPPPKYPPLVPERARRLAAVLAALLWATPGLALPKKKPRPSPTATPTPTPLFRAAGSCIAWVPGKHLVLAEVGTTGRVFRIDASTEISADVRIGSRVRVLYVTGPEGPLARKILPGPIVSPPAPKPHGD